MIERLEPRRLMSHKPADPGVPGSDLFPTDLGATDVEMRGGTLMIRGASSGTNTVSVRFDANRRNVVVVADFALEPAARSDPMRPAPRVVTFASRVVRRIEYYGGGGNDRVVVGNRPPDDPATPVPPAAPQPADDESATPPDAPLSENLFAQEQLTFGFRQDRRFKLPVTMYGLFGDDTLIAAHGRDVLFGGPGNDTLLGQGGADDLAGGAGNDVIEGGSRGDVIDGGGGADTINFQQGSHRVDRVFAGHVDDDVSAPDGEADQIEFAIGLRVPDRGPQDVLTEARR